MALRAVLFDFGNTLVSTRVDWARVVPESLECLCVALRPKLPALDGARLGRDFLFIRQQGKARAARDLIETPAVESLRRALYLQGVAVDAVALQATVDAFFAPEEAGYSTIIGVPETLARLRERGLRLAVVSNATCGHLIRRVLKRHGLLPYFDHVAVSAEVGSCKPDPAILWSAMYQLGAQSQECAVVGDRADTDMEGARRAGMRAVLADFLGDSPIAPPGEPPADALVRIPEELVDVVRAWQLTDSG